MALIAGHPLTSLFLVLLESVLLGPERSSCGWRNPFVIPAARAVVALYLRRSLAETNDSSDKEPVGTFSALGKHWRAFLFVLAYTAGGSLSFYTFTTYMPQYLFNAAHIDKVTASQISPAALLVYMLIQPFFGWLSDRIGRKANMLLYSGLGTLMVVPLMTAIGTTKDPYMSFGLIMIGMAVISFYTGISGIVKAELIPTHVRALGVGLSYAVANSLFGGTAEAVALYLKEQGMESSFFWYLTAMLALGLVASVILPNPQTPGYLDCDGTAHEALAPHPGYAPAPSTDPPVARTTRRAAAPRAPGPATRAGPQRRN